MIAAIDGARDHINMETYIFEDDEVGQRFAAALIAKQQQGVQVNLIRDSVGTMGTPTEFFTGLTDAGINVLEFNPVNPADRQGRLGREPARSPQAAGRRRAHRLPRRHQHQQRLFGRVVQPALQGAPRRQAALARHRPAARRAGGRRAAEAVHRHLGKAERRRRSRRATIFPPRQTQGNEVVRAIGSSPDEPYSLIYATLISAMRSAETEIWLTNAYFVPDPQLLAALKEAVARGVDVKLVLPSSTDSWLVFHAGRAHYTELLKAGVKLYERRDALLHVKTAVIDGVWSTVGSTNLDWRSFLHNQEVNVVVLGTGFGDRMRAAFLADLAKSEPDHARKMAAAPARRPRVKELIGRMWEYWL